MLPADATPDDSRGLVALAMHVSVFAHAPTARVQTRTSLCVFRPPHVRFRTRGHRPCAITDTCMQEMGGLCPFLHTPLSSVCKYGHRRALVGHLMSVFAHATIATGAAVCKYGHITEPAFVGVCRRLSEFVGVCWRWSPAMPDGSGVRATEKIVDVYVCGTHATAGE